MGGFLYKGFFERREGNGLETASFAIAPIVFFLFLESTLVHANAIAITMAMAMGGFNLQFDTIIIINYQQSVGFIGNRVILSDLIKFILQFK